MLCFVISLFLFIHVQVFKSMTAYTCMNPSTLCLTHVCSNIGPPYITGSNYAGSWTKSCAPLGVDGGMLTALCSCLAVIKATSVSSTFPAPGCKERTPALITTFSVDTYNFVKDSVDQVSVKFHFQSTR